MLDALKWCNGAKNADEMKMSENEEKQNANKVENSTANTLHLTMSAVCPVSTWSGCAIPKNNAIFQFFAETST